VKSRLDQNAYLSRATYRTEDHHNTLQLLEYSTHSPTANTIPTPLSVSAPTPSPQTSSSQHQITPTVDANTTQQPPALGVTKTTENNLLNLSVKDLFARQQVSKEVRDIIQSSARLQNKMFLVSSNTTPEPWTVFQKNGRWAFQIIDTNKWSGSGPLTTPVTLNPLLEVIVAEPKKERCIRRTWFGSRWLNERVCLHAPKGSVDSNSGLLHSYISYPPCREAVVSVSFSIEWLTPSTRPKDRPHSAFSKEVKVQLPTNPTFGNLLEAALNGSGEFHFKDQYGFIRTWEEHNLKALLQILGNPRIVLDLPWTFDLVDVVVPKAEEWAEVRERGAG
jgi:hypothetical protein